MANGDQNGPKACKARILPTENCLTDIRFFAAERPRFSLYKKQCAELFLPIVFCEPHLPNRRDLKTAHPHRDFRYCFFG